MDTGWFLFMADTDVVFQLLINPVRSADTTERNVFVFYIHEGHLVCFCISLVSM